MADLPDADVVIVPVGAGSGVCGTCIVAKNVNPKIQVIGVQSTQAPSMQMSWKLGEIVTAEMHTFAEGIATRVPFENTQKIMRQYLDDFILVDDDAIMEAIIHLLRHTHNLAEGAGAAPLAAALSIKEKLSNKKVVLILSGGNLSLQKLKQFVLNLPSFD
jgi:threonine dehydratase